MRNRRPKWMSASWDVCQLAGAWRCCHSKRQVNDTKYFVLTIPSHCQQNSSISHHTNTFDPTAFGIPPPQARPLALRRHLLPGFRPIKTYLDRN